MRFISLIAVLAMVGCATAPVRPGPESEVPARPISWGPWSDDAFAQAKREHKFVLLDLEAVWCHWCHVMDLTTYKDPGIERLMAGHYIAVRVDQDSRPDLASRYEDYGWPATIVFNADGSEIVKRRGYIPPREMGSMLAAIVADPTPGPSVQPAAPIAANMQATLSADVRKRLEDRLRAAYDSKQAAWGDDQKFLNWDNVEYCLVHSRDLRFRQMARQTMDAQRQLIDPVWGGVYQYSTNGDWKHPHFERIMQMQAENLQIYSQAYALWHEPADLESAKAIERFVRNFLTSPDRTFYTSMDADVRPGKHPSDYFKLDDAQRRWHGIPRVDKHVYARENGWMIRALVDAFCASDDPRYLDSACHAADWVVAHRALPGGGYTHDDTDDAGPYLGDTLAMGRACLSLYMATAQRPWLDRAIQAADFIKAHFEAPVGIATTADPHAVIEFDENVALARFANLLFYYSGDPSHRALAERAMRYLTDPQTATHRGFAVGGILLANEEWSRPPTRISVIAARDEPQSLELFHAAIGFFNHYKRVDWIDPQSGQKPPNTDVDFPRLQRPAAFLCTANSCSSPIFAPAELRARLATADR